ncbi:MAG: flagella synthesis protein FlgN [Methylophilaceae bacterium]|uniref:flagella synthesis protein FlgN n=1 Tax=Methylovorus sp. MM2 TaxID=1848038 RepID=UPI0007E15A56|nr:flagellar protein FlgN [Methylovorus sp. MM2]OAM51279.1 flagellar biosynthesis protein FlgN [Methylovorus sp. MM2]
MSQPILFKKDIELADALVAILAREQTNLVRVDIDVIEELLEEKAVLLQKINDVAKSRYQMLAMQNFEASEAGMTAWIAKQKDAQIDLAWSNFQKTLTQAKEMNRVNGVLISKHFNNNRAKLNVLQNVNTGSQFYGPDGHVTSQSQLRGGLQV